MTKLAMESFVNNLYTMKQYSLEAIGSHGSNFYFVFKRLLYVKISLFLNGLQVIFEAYLDSGEI